MTRVWGVGKPRQNIVYLSAGGVVSGTEADKHQGQRPAWVRLHTGAALWPLTHLSPSPKLPSPSQGMAAATMARLGVRGSCSSLLVLRYIALTPRVEVTNFLLTHDFLMD